MKSLKVLSLIFVVVVLCSLLPSCGSLNSEVTVRFIVTMNPDGTTPIIDGDGNIVLDENGKEAKEYQIGVQTVTVKGTKKNPPTALDAARQALGELDFEDGYEITDDGYSIKRVKNYDQQQFEPEEDDTDDRFEYGYGYYYYWNLYIDGEPTTDGRQSENEIYDGSELVFKFEMRREKRKDIDQ